VHHSRARQLLGVPTGAGSAELKAAYRRAVLASHPDVGGDPARFADVVAAYERLTAPPPAIFVRTPTRWQAIRAFFRRTHPPSRRVF
jgi:hypothetical protein